MRPSEQSIVSGRRAIEAAGIDPAEIGCLVHGSVCRDHLEPATACGVHHALGLPERCQAFDVSNACLGMLNGMLHMANQIELGQIRAGLVVGTEDSRSLLETTIDALNCDESLTRESLKPAFASLTIGSASAAVLLVHRDLSRTGNLLGAAAVRAHTIHHELCQGGLETQGTLMQTDSERLLAEGLATGEATFKDFLQASSWSREHVQKTICHQVGGTHRKLMLQSLGLPLAGDYVTYPWLGNTGSVALPVTLAMAVEDAHVRPGDRVALLGIGSGINSIMLAAQWQSAPRGTSFQPAKPHFEISRVSPVASPA
jgi:3-oxoacyl-[acyl-carrier-protein] synthase-3